MSKKILNISSILFLIFFFPIAATSVLAAPFVDPLHPTSAPPPPSQQQAVSVGNIVGLPGLGTVINDIIKNGNSVAPASNALASVLSTIIGVLTIVAGIWFFFQILIAGFNWISSSGDKNKVQEVQHKITNSVIGLAVVVIAYALTSLFGKILGIPNILDIGAAIQLLGPK